MKTLALIAIAGAASSATAQDMLVTVAPGAAAGDWDISAEFLGTAPAPIATVWADIGFELTGDGSDITITSSNAQYNGFFGAPALTSGATASLVGTTNLVFDAAIIDSSNPLDVASFTYAGDAAALGMSLLGQNSAVFNDGSQFGVVGLYQDALGGAGDLSFEIRIVPAPASAALLGLGGLAAVRRRR